MEKYRGGEQIGRCGATALSAVHNLRCTLSYMTGQICFGE